MTANQCVRVTGTKLEYMTDTMKGSSGSPEFDENWHVVGLHRAGGQKGETHGGRVIYPNEGVIISQILQHEKVNMIINEILGSA